MKIDVDAVHSQNGLNLSVCVHKAWGARVGQLGKLRPIVNRPNASFARDSGGSPGYPLGRAQDAILPHNTPAIPLPCRAPLCRAIARYASRSLV